MPNKMNIKLVIPLIILALITAGGLYYYQTNINDEASDQGVYSTHVAGKQGIVLGDEIVSDEDTGNQITDGSTYNLRISEMRQKVNKGFEDIGEKAKYKNLFGPDEIQKIINDTRDNIEKTITDLENIEIAAKFETANKQHIESLQLLLEAINAYDQAGDTEDKTEAQRLSELYAYNIEKSNKLLSKIMIPK